MDEPTQKSGGVGIDIMGQYVLRCPNCGQEYRRKESDFPMLCLICGAELF